MVNRRGFLSDHFNIYTREAGAGELSVAVEGPSKADITITDRTHGYTTVAYVVSEPGQFAENLNHHLSYVSKHDVPDPGQYDIYSIQCGDRLYTSESDVCRRHVSDVFKDCLRTERITIFILAVDP